MDSSSNIKVPEIMKTYHVMCGCFRERLPEVLISVEHTFLTFCDAQVVVLAEYNYFNGRTSFCTNLSIAYKGSRPTSIFLYCTRAVQLFCTNVFRRGFSRALSFGIMFFIFVLLVIFCF